MDYVSNYNGNEEKDFKTTKRFYPRTNNKDVLEFILEKDPNLFLQKNKLVIRGAIEIDQKYTVDNGFAAKLFFQCHALFSMLTVEIDSQVVSTNRCR